MNEATEEKMLSLLSFASKMGSLIYGKEPLERLMNSSALKILFLASNCSENTEKMWVNKSLSTDTKLIKFRSITKKALAERLGKNELSAVSTSNNDLLKGMLKYLENG